MARTRTIMQGGVPCKQVYQTSGSGGEGWYGCGQDGAPASVGGRRHIRRGFRRADGEPDWDTEDVSAQLFNMLEKDGDIQNDKPETNESNADGNYKETKGYDFNKQDIPSFDYADGDFQYMDADCGIMMNADGFSDDVSADGDYVLRGQKDGHPSKRRAANGDVDDTDKGDMYAFGTGGGFDADWGFSGSASSKPTMGKNFVLAKKGISFFVKDKKEPFLVYGGILKDGDSVEVTGQNKMSVSVNGERYKTDVLTLSNGTFIPDRLSRGRRKGAGFQWYHLANEKKHKELILKGEERKKKHEARKKEREAKFAEAREADKKMFNDFELGKYIVNNTAQAHGRKAVGVGSVNFNNDGLAIKDSYEMVKNDSTITVVDKQRVGKRNHPVLKLDNGKFISLRAAKSLIKKQPV